MARRIGWRVAEIMMALPEGTSTSEFVATRAGDWFVCVVKVRIRKWGHAFFAKFLTHSRNLTPAAMVDAGEIVTKIDFEIGG